MQRKEAFKSANEARKEKENALKSKEEIDRLRMLAEAKNIALKSSQILNNPNKDNISIQLSFLSYSINRQLQGPIQNRTIYEAFKRQLDKYYIKNIRSRKDLIYDFGGYENRAISFSSETEFITGGDEGILKKYQIIGNPKEFKTITVSKKYPESFTTLCVTNDSKYVFAGTANGSVVEWNPLDAASFMKIINKESGRSIFLGNLPSNENYYNVLSALNNKISIIKIEKTTLKVEKKIDIYNSPTNKINSVCCYSKDNLTYLFFSADKIIYQLSIDSKESISEIVKCLEFPESLSAMSISNNGEYLTLGGISGMLISYKKNSTNYSLYQKFAGHLSTVTSIKYSGNNNFFISGSLDHSIHVNQVLKSNNDEELFFEEKETWIRDIAITPNNDYIVTVGQSNLIQIWPAQLKIILKDLQSIKEYKTYFDTEVNEQLIKDELGDELFKSIWKLDIKNDKFGDFWKSIQSKYLMK